MSILTIHDVDDELERRLRTRAVVHGRSIEAEARAILTEVLGDAEAPAAGNLADAIRAIMAPIGGVDLPPFPDQPAAEPIRLG